MCGTVWMASLRVLDNDFQKGKVNLSLREKIQKMYIGGSIIRTYSGMILHQNF